MLLQLAIPAGASGGIGGCPVFPVDNVWNTPVDYLPVHPDSKRYVEAIGRDLPLHPDFGSRSYRGRTPGIPFVVVPADQNPVKISFRSKESDPGPYPIPPDAPIEGGRYAEGDRHVIIVQSGTCKLFELFAAFPNRDGTWRAGSGATFDLRSNALRPANWTSADGAGLPVFPGLVRYEEVESGVIDHALRFTVPKTGGSYVWPARHRTFEGNARLPPMGLRFRLKAGVDLTTFPQPARVILDALKKYGMMVADNGGPWFLSGATDPRWSGLALSHLKRIRGDDFEAVDAERLRVEADSGRASQTFAGRTTRP